MTRLAFAPGCLLAACAALAAPVPIHAPVFFKPGWGKPIDPDKDCTFIQTKETLTIEIPGKDHDINPGQRRMNAPRLMREVKGDFRLDVRVSSEWPLSRKSSVVNKPEGRGYRETNIFIGAGILVMDDNKQQNIVRFEFGSIRQEGHPQPYLAFRYYCGPLSPGMHLSPDGTEIRPTTHFEIVNLPAKLKVGLFAVSTSTEPLKVRFDQFKLTELPAAKKPDREK
jgi:hypothetical protein